MSILVNGLVILLLVSPAMAGWRAACRQQARQCRAMHGPTTTTTSTTIPHFQNDSENCTGVDCVLVPDLRGTPQVYCAYPASLACQGPCVLPH